MNKLLYAGMFCLVAFGAALAVELTGSIPVNVTSDTAAQAKTKAFNSARRDVVLRALRPYANSAQLEEAVRDSSNEELMNIISSSSVASEKISDTTYSANISFVIDSDAARSWMEKYSIQNTLPISNSIVAVPENFVVVTAMLLQPIADWILLNAIARDAKIDLATTNIIGNNVSFAVSDKDISRFYSALRASGWHVQQTADGVKIWK